MWSCEVYLHISQHCLHADGMGSRWHVLDGARRLSARNFWRRGGEALRQHGGDEFSILSLGVDGTQQMGSRTKSDDRRRRSSLLNVGRRMDYAMRALSYIAAQPPWRTVPRAEVQGRQQIPPHFLSKILRSLVSAGLLISVPGARGGFRLRLPADRVSVRDVYECIEGPLCLMECIEDQGSCCFAPVCTQVSVWRGAQQALARYLERISIKDIADYRGLSPRLGEFHHRLAPPVAAAREQVER